MAFVVKEDKTGSPVHVSLFGPAGIMFGAYRVAHLIEGSFPLEEQETGLSAYCNLCRCLLYCEQFKLIFYFMPSNVLT